MDSKDLDAASTLMQTEEVALVDRAKAGDADAFGDLVRAYQRRAVSLAYRLLGNMEDASDVSQDAFVRAYRHLHQLDDATKFGGWLLRVVGNLSLNFRRSRACKSSASLEDVGPASAVGRSPATGQRLAVHLEDEEGALSRELNDAVTAAMDCLPEKQRLALILFSVEGIPQKEVAEILECSVELVKWNVFQARKKLKDMLKAYL